MEEFDVPGIGRVGDSTTASEVASITVDAFTMAVANSAAIPRDVLIGAFDIEAGVVVQHFADRVGEVQRELRDDIERDVYDIIASDVDWCDDEQIYLRVDVIAPTRCVNERTSNASLKNAKRGAMR